MSPGGLDGLGVLVTRPKHQAAELTAAIEATGGKVVLFPVIEIAGSELRDIDDELRRMPPPDIAVFVSRNAVQHGWPAFRDHPAKFAAVGPATRDAIEAQGGAVQIYPQDGFDSEHLLQHPEFRDADGKRVVIVRGQSGRELLADTLRQRGATVTYLCAYERKPREPSKQELERLQSALGAGQIHFMVVMSVDSLKSLLEITPLACRDYLQRVTLVAPSARVLQTASELIPGINAELANGPQASDIVETLVSLAQSGQVS